MLAVLIGLGAAVAAALFGLLYLTDMPGRSANQQPAVSQGDQQTADRMRASVEYLAGTIGGRSAGPKYENLKRSADWLSRRLTDAGYAPQRQQYEASGLSFENIEAELRGSANPDRVIVIGAHYDTAGGLPGANDNGSGVAAVLELASRFAAKPQKNTIRWVLFANEEPPWFQGPGMGSYVYARRCKERREQI
ncbi:MAG TPA: M28 family peptidase, partial [Bryobacteraceae bacterium]|nr:M28 family peptidase [Bryobacteraceae bacterium]